MADKIRILIAEDQEENRQKICKLLEKQSDMVVVGDTADGNEAVALASQLGAEVAVVDLTVPNGGLRLLERLTAAQPGLRILVLALHEEISLLRSVLAFSSLGYVVHRGDSGGLLSTIRKFQSGRGYVDVPTGGLIPDPALDPRSEKHRELQAQLAILSKREKEVLRAVAYGFTNREIAERLGVSVKSVETYRYRVAEKLSFKSRADLVRFALEVGLLRTGQSGLPASG
jgi:DNA-binding NarL/FixJ family response regulator